MFGGDREVRVERVVLEDHRDVAVASGGSSVTSRSPMQIAPGVDLLEPGEHPQRGRLAGARRADEHHQLAVRDVEVERVDRRRRRCRGRSASPARSGRQPSTRHRPSTLDSSVDAAARWALLRVAARRAGRARAAPRRRSAAAVAMRTATAAPTREAVARSRPAAARRADRSRPPPSSTSTGCAVELEPVERDARRARRPRRRAGRRSRPPTASCRRLGEDDRRRARSMPPLRDAPEVDRLGELARRVERRSAPARRARALVRGPRPSSLRAAADSAARPTS